MSVNFSLHKLATSFSPLFVGALFSLLAAQFLPTNPLLVKQPVAQLASSSTTTPEMAEKVDGAGIMLGLVAVGGGAVGIVLIARKAKNSSQSSSTTPDFSPSSSYNSTIRVDQGSRELQRKLLRLLHDDRDTANRLLSQVKMKNPNRAINWYFEKVIYDLERDHGRY